MQDHKMRDGNTIPPIGLGTYGMKDTDAEMLVSEALRLGYRLIDTAKNYENEAGVGRGVLRSGIDRNDIFVTSKVPGRDHGFDAAIASVKGTLDRMGLRYLDMALIHWPNPSQNRYVDTWRGLISLQEEGIVKTIGVSNFLPEHIDRLVEETGVTPAVNQVELTPYFQQQEVQKYNADHAIITQCWSPLGRGTDLLTNPTITAIAEETGKSPAQVILRWEVQKQLLPIPRSTNLGRMEENLQVFDWELTDEQEEKITLLDSGVSGFNFDPRTHEEM